MRFSAILLAAGESRRMGAINKLTLPVAGQPLLRRTARTLLRAGLEEIVVVLGHQRHLLEPLLRDLPLNIVCNDDYREGQMTSVHRGLAAMRQACDAVLVCLADLPLLEVADLRRLANAFVDCPTSVLVPTYQGARGNPIVLACAHREQILAGERNLGCRRLVEKHPELVTALAMDTDHVVFDLDTPQAYQELQRRLGESGATTPVSNFG